MNLKWFTEDGHFKWPRGTAIGCDCCGSVWIESLGYALVDLFAPVTCPRCKGVKLNGELEEAK